MPNFNFAVVILSPISPFGQPNSPTPSTKKILQTNRRFDKEKYCGKSKIWEKQERY